MKAMAFSSGTFAGTFAEMELELEIPEKINKVSKDS
jgi:hypothetical protein